MECICGDPTESTATAAGPGPFSFPGATVLAVALRTERAPIDVADPATECPLEPEAPVPRAS
jgi:hypothetical protein